ncbi:CotO family spore coat protein [Fredinandcohnia humi]
MSDKRKFPTKTKPVIYVYQPQSQDQPMMQSKYVIKEWNGGVVGNQNMIETVEFPEQKERVQQHSIQEQISEQSIRETIEEKENLGQSVIISGKKKRFKEMNVQEKIHYLTHLPKNIPQFICEIVTKDVIYQGVILAASGDTVNMRSLTTSQKEQLMIEGIEDITIIGF